MTPTQIRVGEAQDAARIAALVNAAFRPERSFSDADRTNIDKVSALLETGRFFLIFEDEALAGCVYAEVRGERGYFGLLAVDPTRQRAGLGGRLIDEAEKHCRAAGCRFMDLTFVNAREKLPGYYRRFGYKENGTLPFPTDQAKPKFPVHLVRMSKEL